MPEVHVYVSERDKALIAALPPEVTVASILREALEGRRGCEHDLTVVRCVRCGASLDGHGDLDSLADDDQADDDLVDENGQVNGVAFPSSPDADPVTIP